MKVKRFLNAPDSVYLPQEERARLGKLVEAQFPAASHVNIVASSDGPICEVTIPRGNGKAPDIYVGRVDAVVPDDLLL